MHLLRASINILLILTVCSIAKNVFAGSQLFKINKLNLIWTKAQHSLGSGKLKDLKTDLARHELDELSLKKMKALNQDKDGLFEATIRRKLLTIMTKYSLDKYYDDIHPPIDDEHEQKRSNLEQVKSTSSGDQLPDLSKHTFRDKRLDKLWKKAELSRFSQEELMVLHEEFQHQQDRIDEHYEAINTLEQDRQKKEEHHADSRENTIESTHDTKRNKETRQKAKETPEEKKARLSINLNQGLKKEYSDIKKDIEKLHQKIVSGRILDVGPFEEEPVNELWSEALKANFTTGELESLKEELEHYEVRIKKLKHFQNQLERNKVGSKNSDMYKDDNDETKHIKRRVKELKYKVSKTHETIRKKITEPRDEL